MKTTTTILPLPKFTAFGAELIKRNTYLSILCLIFATLWNTHSVTAAPAKLDSLDSTFPLDLQPPIFEATASASSPSQSNSHVDGATTIDSYGNPIGSLQPIKTPDGRKVVSAQGLQFEIPNYASGITELKKPTDDLLPPFIDPIVVALPNASTESVDVESVPLTEVKTIPTATHGALKAQSKGLPDYILALNDPDIGGPVDYEPAEDKRILNVITWDLLPPLETEITSDKSISASNQVSVTTGHNLNAQTFPKSSQSTLNPRLGLEKHNHNREENVHSSTTTTSRTPTTFRSTTTPRTTQTTTRKTTIPTTTTTSTTTPQPESSEFFKLEAGDSYTLPPWLQDIDDPDLDVAVAFEIPEDINEYNHTIVRDLLAPLEPYTDLSNLNLTPLSNQKEAIVTSTTDRTTTTSTTTTTAKRPALSTAQPHWIRAKPTSPKPTKATFHNQFTSLSPSKSSTNFAQRTTSTTTTTTVKPHSSTKYYNRQLSSNIPQTDKIGSSSEEVQAKSRNPLSSTLNDGKYKSQATTIRTTTTTTTTTTTPAPIVIEKNPFEATIPPWLKDFDYPGLGPGVPFIYDPNEDENTVNKNILPPSKTEEPNKTNPSSTSTSPILNSHTPQGFTNKFTSSAIPLTSSSSIPSIVTIPLPSTQTNQDDSTFTRQAPVFVPPTPTSAEGITYADKSEDFSKKTSPTFKQNFPAPFEPTYADSTTDSDGKKIPLSADRESFPPINNIIAGSSTPPIKTTFTKSEDGKVITNNAVLSSGSGSPSTKSIGSSQAASSQEKNTFTTQSSTGSALTTSAAASAFVTASGSTSTLDSGATTDFVRYTGSFGGPPGILAPQVNGFSDSSAIVTKSYNKATITTSPPVSSPAGEINNKDKFVGSFGGPPGILKPFDTVKNR